MDMTTAQPGREDLSGPSIYGAQRSVTFGLAVRWRQGPTKTPLGDTGGKGGKTQGANCDFFVIL